MLAALAMVIVLAGQDVETAADSVTLRDGKVVLGQWVEPAPRGKIALVVRRSWAETAIPDRFKVWQAAESPWVKRARADRIRRLEHWKGESPVEAIARWIDDELERLKGSDDTSPLMIVTINRGDARKIVRRQPDSARKLRQAWRGKFDDAETRPVGELTSALEGRGFAMSDVDAATIDDLLPVPAETEPRWRARRAATEVALDPSCKFVQYQGLVLPEGKPAEMPDASGAVGGLLKSLLGGEAQEDPLVGKGKELAEKGRVGMLVTKLETAEDLSGVRVEIILYARVDETRWEKATARFMTVRGDEIRPNEGGNIGNDPQVQGLFRTIEGLGLDLPADLKQKSLNIGAATQRALGLARTAIQPDLDALALPVDRPGRNSK